MARLGNITHIYNITTKNLVNECLNEMFHIMDTFDKCSEFLINNIDKFDTNYKYCGWNFISKEKTCINCNDENIKYPIYIRIITDFNDNNYYSVKDRSEKNNNINKIFLTINNAWESDLANGFGHEFSHAFDMYIKEFNIISNENVIDINDEVVQKLMIDNKTLEELNSIVYCLMPSEQRGHLNGTIKYLKRHFSDLIYKHFNDIIEYSYNVNLLKKFNIMVEELKTKTYYYIELKNIQVEHYRFINKYYFFAYFCKEYAKLNIKNINKEKVLNYQNISFKEKQDVIKDIMNKIDENFENYKNKLYDTVYVHIYEPLTKYWKAHNIRLHTDQT